MAEDEWWREAFGAAYLDVYAHRDDAQAAAEVAGMLPRLREAPGPILDVGCGHGRHLQALRAAGLAAFGFDFSPELCAVATRRSGCAGRVARADMRAPPIAPQSCGAVLLLFTAFGYFSDEENAALLRRLSVLLRPDGYLVLDLPDPEHVKSTLVRESNRTTRSGTNLNERRRLDGRHVIKEVGATRAGSLPYTWTERVRLYAREEIEALASQSPLSVDRITTFGPEGSPTRHEYWLRKRVT